MKVTSSVYNLEMSKKHSKQSNVTERIATPVITKGNNGEAILMCPFCIPSHVLSASNTNGCGSMVQMRVVQTVYRAKYNDKLVCVKCAKGGGEMVRFMEAFIHIPDCMPGVATLVDPPPFSRFAKFVSGRGKLKPLFEYFTGVATPIEEVMPDGTRTGVTLGYFFKRIANAKRATTSS